MALRAHRTTSTPSTAGTRGHALLHRGDATVEVLAVGPDCVSVSVTRAPSGSGRRTGTGHPNAPTTHHTGPPSATEVEPHVRAVLDAAAESRGPLLPALTARLGGDVAGIVLEQRGRSVVVTLDLLPTRRARRRTTAPPRPRSALDAR